MSDEPKLFQAVEDRRHFLHNCGRFAATVPPALTILLSTSLTSEAIAKSIGGGGGGSKADGGPPKGPDSGPPKGPDANQTLSTPIRDGRDGVKKPDGAGKGGN